MRRKVSRTRPLIATIPLRIGLCMRGFIRRGTCLIIRRSAVATMRTATRPKSNLSTARSMRSAGRTGNTFSFRPRKWSGTGIIPTAAITFALHRRASRRTPSIPSTASRWEAPREIRVGEWQDALPADFLHAALRVDQKRLSARDHDAVSLLRLRVLLALLRIRGAVARGSRGRRAAVISDAIGGGGV